MCIKVSFKKPDEEIPDCCDAELIRNTFKKLNCEIVYANELKYKMDLNSGIARAIISGMLKTNNIVIVETITWPNCCPLMTLPTRLKLNAEDLRTYNTNLIIYTNYKNTMIRTTTGSAINIFEGVMKCLKIT